MSRSMYARLARRFAPSGHISRELALSRRDLLKATAAGSVGMLLSGLLGSCAFDRSGRPAAAYCERSASCHRGRWLCRPRMRDELASVGYGVTVLEARSRVGGRVLTFNDFVPGKTVEGGGELIGSNHPTWVAYAKEFDLEFLDVTESEDLSFPISLDGHVLDDVEAEALWEEMDAALIQMNADAQAVIEDEPWTTPDAPRLDLLSTRAWLNSLGLSDRCLSGVIAQLNADNGAAVEQQSYLGNLCQVKGGGVEAYWTESEVYRCRGGNQQLAMRLSEGLAERVVCQQPVRSVVWSENGCKVETEAGDIHECDDVVLAVPPSVWGRIACSPALPHGLSPQMGINVKTLTAVKRRFWLDRGVAPDCLCDGPIAMTWDGTDGQSGDEAAALVGFSGGPSAAQLRSNAPDQRAAAVNALLEPIYEGLVTNAIDHRFMDWPADPRTMAGYSFPAPGQVLTMAPTMRHGLGRLHFAGEHACPKFVGYMEGALNSGASLARRIAVRDGVAASIPQ